MCDVNSYKWYKAHHICVKCGHENAVRNHTQCLECMMKSRESARAYNKKNKEKLKEKNRICHSRRYYKLKELGLCTSCGKRKTKNNKTYCDYCSARKNRKTREKYLLNIYATKNMCEIRV